MGMEMGMAMGMAMEMAVAMRIGKKTVAVGNALSWQQANKSLKFCIRLCCLARQEL